MIRWYRIMNRDYDVLGGTDLHDHTAGHFDKAPKFNLDDGPIEWLGESGSLLWR